MVTTVPSGTGIFIIDTEQDASRFGDGLCAYLTGCIGDYGIGEAFASLYEEETCQEPLANVLHLPDDNGVMSPWSVWPTEGWFSNGAGGCYRRGQEQQALADFRKYIIQERANLLRQKKTFLSTHSQANKGVQAMQDGVKHQIIHHQHEIKAIAKKTRIPVFPAYLSVAIFFRCIPDNLTVDILKLRAFQFVDARRKVEKISPVPINITGFRLLRAHHIKHLTQLA